MQLTEEQFKELAENYANHIVDTMDTKCLAQFAFDCIIENLPIDGDGLIEEILDSYDQEVLDMLLEGSNISPIGD